MMPINQTRRLLDNDGMTACRIINTIGLPDALENLLIYESTHKHRKTVEQALIHRLKEVIHVQRKEVPSVSGVLARRW